MRSSSIFLPILALAFLLFNGAHAKKIEGYVTLINKTPYDWRLTDQHAYQMDWNFPEVIKAGTSHEQLIRFKRDHKDDAAEAYYTLENCPHPASFVVKARQAPRHIEVEFRETLVALNNPERSTHYLGFVQDGAVAFVLSGEAGSFTSSNPPGAWMQAMLPTIGTRSLREISMPASHDAGMYRLDKRGKLWGGSPHNTQTQSGDVFEQLRNGARFLDIKPVFFQNFGFWTGHFSRSGRWSRHYFFGGIGGRISEIVTDINAFTRQYPGELIILDISHEMNATQRQENFPAEMFYGPLSSNQWKLLLYELSQINALWIPSPSDLRRLPDDLSTVPLSTFITPGSPSAVLVRLPQDAPLPGPNSRQSYNRRDVNATIDDEDDGGEEDDEEDEDDDGISAPGPALVGHSKDVAVATAEPKLTAKAISARQLESHHAFFHASRLLLTGHYTDTDDLGYLTRDQLAKLGTSRQQPTAPIHQSFWIIPQKNFLDMMNFAKEKRSIRALAALAHRNLYRDLPPVITPQKYPNLISIDDFSDTSVTALCVAINNQAKPA